MGWRIREMDHSQDWKLKEEAKKKERQKENPFSYGKCCPIHIHSIYVEQKSKENWLRPYRNAKPKDLNSV